MSWRKLLDFDPRVEWNGWATLALVFNAAMALYNLVISWRPELVAINAAALALILWLVRPDLRERHERRRLIRAWQDRQARLFEEHILREQTEYERRLREDNR